MVFLWVFSKMLYSSLKYGFSLWVFSQNMGFMGFFSKYGRNIKKYGMWQGCFSEKQKKLYIFIFRGLFHIFQGILVSFLCKYATRDFFLIQCCSDFHIFCISAGLVLSIVRQKLFIFCAYGASKVAKISVNTFLFIFRTF